MLVVVEIVLVVCLALFLLTQVVVPAAIGGRMFPMFRKTAKLEAELEVARQEVFDEELAQEVEEVQKVVAAQKKRRPRSRNRTSKPKTNQ